MHQLQILYFHFMKLLYLLKNTMSSILRQTFMIRQFKTYITQIFAGEYSTHLIVQSCSLGIFIACSPLLGIQTIVACAACRALALSIPITLLMLNIINNPLTMVPIIWIDYATGAYIFSNIFPMNLAQFEPAWSQKITDYCMQAIGSTSGAPTSFFGNYVVGGFIFAALCTLCAYPILKLLTAYYAPSPKNS